MTDLATLNILLTRPRPQATSLQQALEHLHAKVYLFPTIEIKPIISTALQNSLSTIDYNGIIFTSQNAVIHSKSLWPQQIANIPIYAVGSATATCLKDNGIENIIVPQHYSSEGLLAMPSLNNINDQKFLIVGGKNPKPLLQETLQKRGAIVTTATCYERCLPPTHKALTLAKLQKIKLSLIITSSPSSLRNLYAIFNDSAGTAWLNQQRFIVISEAMRQLLSDYGNTQTSLVAANATDQAIIETLLDSRYNGFLKSC